MSSKIRKKHKLKKKFVVILFFVFIVIASLIGYLFIVNSNTYKLGQVGYSESEIKMLEQNLSKDGIDIVLENTYLSYIFDLIEEKDFKDSNLSKYINYIENVNTDYEMKDITYLVNNNISHSYSEELVSLINSKYFLLNRLDRYINYDKSEDIGEIITYVNSNRDVEYYTNSKDTDISKNELMIVNKYYGLSEDYVSENMVVLDSNYDNKSNSKLDKITYEAFKKLSDDARSEGYYIYNNSAYRSYNHQLSVYNDYKNSRGLDYAETIAARPGFSEHQTGLALDVGVKADRATGIFENSKEFTWMKNNCYKYGFILRYPKGKEDITGYQYEPWHYRYVGVEVATYIYENDITFEEYYAFFVEKE